MSRIVLQFLIVLFAASTVVADDDRQLVAKGAKVEKLAGGMKFTEGPVWLPSEKKLVFSDIPNSKLMQWSEADGLSVYRDSEQANGNILDLQGRIISCQHKARNVIRIEADGSTTLLADRFDGKRFNSPNDVAIRSDGTLWFTDPPWGLTGSHEIPGHWVYKLEPKTGKVEVVHKYLAMPNGIVFSPDESRIYIADTGGHKRHPDPDFHKLPASIQCYEIDNEGNLGKKLFQIASGSDGMAVDAQGNLYATHGGKVHIYDADGNERQQIDVPEGPANVCFGGDDHKTLFITARTSLYSVRMRVAGAKLKGASK
ncbi:MAG: SMP-30/gluconolactonase/LRE family protein [Pirellulales bacterium]|jgi:gluconolactonase|nr:SMP-30/gluconolactonase/LRE family protein [Pirellulales bacterium]